jgi:phenylacetate-coenzyme A ligase PaaK-like adenylate-forming protein
VNHKKKFRDSVITATVRNASNIPFYRKFWKQVNLNEIRSAEDLRYLPIIDKTLYQTHYQDAILSDDATEIVTFSTGTAGKMSFRYRSASELQYIRQFFSSVHHGEETKENPVPLALAFYNRYHGKKIPVPGNVFTLEAGLFEEPQIEQALSILQKNFRLTNVASRVTQVHGEINNHKVLLSILLSRGLKPEILPVKVLGSSGYASRFWINRLEKAWQARFVNHYSLSEIFGGAAACFDCGWFHVETHVVPQIADPVTHSHLDEGVGVLVLTELYPLIRFQPLIRYNTGDLVEAGLSQCPRDNGNLSFRMLGRFCRAIIDENNRTVLVCPSTLHELLDEIPSVKKEEIIINGSKLPRFEVGDPLWGYKITPGEPSKLTVHIVCKFDHRIYEEPAGELRERICHAVVRDSPVLKEGIETGKYVFEVNLCSEPDFIALTNDTF